MELKQKYLHPGKAKFGGKKRTAGNSGNVGRACRRKKRAHVVSQNSSPEQYATWRRATGAA